MTTIARALRYPVAVLSTCLLLLACDRSSAARPDQPRVLPTLATSSPSSSRPTTSPLQARVLAAYAGMRSAEVRAYASPEQPHVELREHAIDRALVAIEQTMLLYRQRGIVVEGQPKIHPRTVTVQEGAPPRLATVVDCFDASHWTPVDAATGRAVSAPGQAQRYVVTARVALVGERWLVSDVSPDRSRAC